MALPTVDLPSQVVGAGETASSYVGPGAGTVRTSAGTVGTAADALTFATGVGAWVSADLRARIRGVPLVSAVAVGTRALPAPPGTAPVAVVGGSSVVRSS